MQAAQFLRRRLVSALVSADPNHPVSPVRRAVLGTALGLAALLLVSGVVGVVGLLRPGSAGNWRQGGQVIVEKETGARFVLGEDGALHPVLNYASARLLAGGDGKRTVTLSAKALADAPRGAALGIPDAPDSVPDSSRLLAGSWVSCTRRSRDQPHDAEPTSTVLLGHSVGGDQLAPGQGLVVGLGTGARFLVTEGRRHLLPDNRAITALGYASTTPLPVSSAWLNTVPVGRDLGVVAVAGSGSAGPTVGGVATRVGQVLVSTGADGTEVFYVVRREGLAVVTETEASLVLGSPSAAAAYGDAVPRPVPVTALDVPTIARPHSGDEGEYPPRRPTPTRVADDTTVCATDIETGRTKILVGAAVPGGDHAKPIRVTQPSPRTATEVYVPGGAGALVAEQPAPGVGVGGVHLLTDTGSRYPVPGEEAVKSLGYGGVTPKPVPSTLLALFPSGPALDPARARRAVSG
ncbi:type VII secretion protein EccB [Streptoalloteichus tenebrarius]|uniref:Type VII secretion protein EccB n=1 Tax=Streptoalloteichus tenebrarius (strain ATCC 17920 / DSM 40477 / JCM 4838 / CBS 697.72 / NBRC 16177 / NCIMB 11028 / NRRL B-12390 / A12253. 1 / ISP 5477) TaxID=1933 RepID=A0ABT1HUW5_STRSD|nr:type VII secretion protein EccB [Streptoalloteichus tenebrarius]BFE99079.1 type VII secretion protein EccB [Streptoalloteichus tenebrarius]